MATVLYWTRMISLCLITAASLCLCASLANSLPEYDTVIAIYNSSSDFNANCSKGAAHTFILNSLSPENVTDKTLIRLCSKSFTLEKKNHTDRP